MAKYAFIILMSVLWLVSCEGVLSVEPQSSASRGAKGVCDTLKSGGAETREGKRNDDYQCQTQAAGGRILVTAISSSFSPNQLEEVLLEGRYPDRVSGEEMKQEMLEASSALFLKLNMDPPPGLALTIHTRSRSEVAAGRMRVNVDHVCGSAGADCKISIQVQLGPRPRRV